MFFRGELFFLKGRYLALFLFESLLVCFSEEEEPKGKALKRGDYGKDLGNFSW